MAIYDPNSNQHSDGRDSEISIPSEASFIITINDLFCSWEFGFNITDEISIQDIADTILEKYPGIITYRKYIPELNNNNKKQRRKR